MGNRRCFGIGSLDGKINDDVREKIRSVISKEDIHEKDDYIDLSFCYGDRNLITDIAKMQNGLTLSFCDEGDFYNDVKHFVSMDGEWKKVCTVNTWQMLFNEIENDLCRIRKDIVDENIKNKLSEVISKIEDRYGKKEPEPEIDLLKQ